MKDTQNMGVNVWLQNPWVVIACVIVGVIFLALLSRIATTDRHPVSRGLVEKSEALLRSANKWAAQAEQDNNPLVAVMDSCYARAYAMAVRRLLDDAQTTRIHKVNMPELLGKMDKAQQDALARVAEVAPQLMPQGEFAVRSGWLG